MLISNTDFIYTSYSCGHRHLEDLRPESSKIFPGTIVFASTKADDHIDQCPKCVCSHQEDMKKLERISSKEYEALTSLKILVAEGYCKKLDVKTGKLMQVQANGDLENNYETASEPSVLPTWFKRFWTSRHSVEPKFK
jgi:hypothetical protein